MTKLLCVVVGGGLGSVLRYLLSSWGQRAAGSDPFPVGTLLVNVLGCLAMGVLGAHFAMHGGGVEWRLLLLVVLLGGFTTFSRSEESRGGTGVSTHDRAPVAAEL
jgi:CrcB protein